MNIFVVWGAVGVVVAAAVVVACTSFQHQPSELQMIVTIFRLLSGVSSCCLTSAC